MEIYITELSKYFITLFMALYTLECFLVFRYQDEESRSGCYVRQNLLMFLVHFSCFLVICFETGKLEYLLFYEQTVSSAWVNEFCLLGNYTLIIFITVLIYSLQILCRINNRYDRKMDQMIIAAVNRAFLSGGDPLYTKKNIDGAKAAGILSLGFLRYLLDI